MKLKKLKPFLWCMFIALIFSAIRIYDPYPVEIIRLKGLDFYQRQQEAKISQEISIVEIDEASLEQYGQWPWKRDILSNGIIKAFENNAALVVLPILFAEEDRLGGDEFFIQTIQNYPVVTSQSASLKGKGKVVPRGISTIGTGLYNWLYDYPAGIGPLDSIGKYSAGVGMLLTAPELDGVVRRLPLLIQINGEPYPTIPLEVLRLFGGEQSYQVKVDEMGINKVRVLGVNTIDTDQHSRVWINFNNEFNKISFIDNDWTSLENKIVVIALTAEGLSNSVATPIKVSNGHELNMQVLQMLIDGNTLNRPVDATINEVLITLGISLILTLGALFLLYYINVFLLLITVILLPYTGFYLFNNYNLLYDYTYPLYSTFIIFTIAIFFRFIHEFKGRMLIKKQFEHYLAPEIVKKLQKNPDMLKLGGDTQDLTILFSDIRGFTTISEQFKDNPQGLTDLINRYLTPMTQIVMESGGTIDKYIGDALMAFWNAPIPEDKTSHRIKAIEVAIKMQSELEKLNIQLVEEGKKELAIGIGINTGTVVVGNMGSDQRFDYTCLGDAVNLSARLEGQTKSYGVGILLGEETIKHIEDKFKFIELDKIAVKGKKEGKYVYTVLDKFNHTLHNAFLEYYKNRKWKQALLTIEKIFNKGTQLEFYYKEMEKRVVDLAKNDPGEDWDQVYRLKTK